MYKIFVMAFFVLALAGCRSRFETQETAFACDSVTVVFDETSTTSLSVAADSAALSSQTCDLVEFADDGGQVLLHPDGLLELKGVAAVSHRGRVSAVRKTAASAASDSVALRAESKAESISHVEKSGRGMNEPQRFDILRILAVVAAVIFITIGIWRKLKD